jgi:hypothetical protein
MESNEKDATKKTPRSHSKIQKIQKLYGNKGANATLEQASEYLTSKGYKPLADFLVPLK